MGVNYKNAGLSIRDKISFTDQKKLQFFAQMEELGIRQCLILSTCNRSEVFYLDDAEPQEMQTDTQQLSAETMQRYTRTDEVRSLYKGIFPETDLEGIIQELCGKEALLYFYRIAAGLESQVIGEDQILGQVREAYEFSRTQGYTGKELNRIAQDAIAAAKRVKTKYHISKQPLSIAYIGILHLNAICPIRGKRALVIGSGQTAVLAVRYLYDYGAAEVCVCSRNFAHARRLQEEFPKLRAFSYEERYQVLSECSVIVSATSAPHLVLRESQIRQKESEGAAGGARVYLDLAAPRDIDPAIADMPDAVLIDLDTLQQVSDRNRKKREQLGEACSRELCFAVRETGEWLAGSRVDQTLATLQEKCDEIVEDSFAYLNRKMVLEPREQKLLKRTLHASLKRLLREPIRELKQSDSEHRETYEQVLRALFHMDNQINTERKESSASDETLAEGMHGV